MFVALYKNGPRAGQKASTADAIRAYPGSLTEAIHQLQIGSDPRKLPKSLMSAIRRQHSPSFEVEFVSPTIEKTTKPRPDLRQERLPAGFRNLPAATASSQRFGNFNHNELQLIEELLSTGKRFDLRVTYRHSFHEKNYTGSVELLKREGDNSLWINEKDEILLKELSELTITRLN